MHMRQFVIIFKNGKVSLVYAHSFDEAVSLIDPEEFDQIVNSYEVTEVIK